MSSAIYKLPMPATPLIRFYIVGMSEHAYIEDGTAVLRVEAYIDELDNPVLLELELGDDPEMIRRMARVLREVADKIEKSK